MSHSRSHTDNNSTFQPEDQDPNDPAFVFRSNLQHYVKSKFTSVAAFVRESGFSKASYYDWVSGKSLPEMLKVFQMAQLLGIPVSKLFELEKSDIGTEKLSEAYRASKDAYEAAARSLKNLSEFFDLPDPTVPPSDSSGLYGTRTQIFDEADGGQ